MEYETKIKELQERLSSLPVDKLGKRRGIGKDLRRDIVNEFEGSGLTIREYCKAIGISIPSFSAYRKKEQESYHTKKSGGFQKLQVVRSIETESKNLIIEGPQGLKVTGLSLSELSKLWRSLC